MHVCKYILTVTPYTKYYILSFVYITFKKHVVEWAGWWVDEWMNKQIKYIKSFVICNNLG